MDFSIREVFSGLLGTMAIGLTLYLLFRDLYRDFIVNGFPSPHASKQNITPSSKVWIGIIGFSFGSLLLWNAFHPGESRRMVPYGAIVALIPEDLRGRYEACQLMQSPPSNLRCSTVEFEWKVAFETAQSKAMRSSR